MQQTIGKYRDGQNPGQHADGGTDPEDESGFLSGQWAPYLKYTMADLMAGGKVMDKKLKKKLLKELLKRQELKEFLQKMV